MELLSLLRELNSCHGPAGQEKEIAAKIAELAAPYADEITVDTLGSVIVRKKGTGPKVMFSAHMDSIGFIVTHAEKEGFLRVAKVGGIAPNAVLNTPVRFKNGLRGTVSSNVGVEAGKRTMDDLFLDIGAADRDQALSMVQIGDTAVYDTPVFSTGSRLVSPYMDNRVSCAVLLLALERLGESDNDLYFVFSVQEEVGLRGAKTAAYAIDPDYGIAVDVTASDDLPGSKHACSSKLGGGAAIKVMDSSVICHPQMVKLLSALAREQGITAQLDIISAGGTDAGAIHLTRSGVYTGGISIPCRYIHSPTEMVDGEDVAACVALVKAFAETKLDTECKVK